jgi:hypothetical protein
MTALNTATTLAAHPAWCEETDCGGEHAAYWPPIDITGHATEPTTVSASPVWAETDGLEPGVALRLQSSRTDVAVDLTLAEAQALADMLARALVAIHAQT